MTGFYTITSIKSGTEQFKVFGIREGDASFAQGKLIFSRIFVFPEGAKHCTCTFVGSQNCGRHRWKDIGFFNPETQDIQVFKRFHGCWNDYQEHYEKSEEEKYANLFSFLLKKKHEVCSILEAIPCCRCGELLTNPDSIRNGIGPVCATLD